MSSTVRLARQIPPDGTVFQLLGWHPALNYPTNEQLQQVRDLAHLHLHPIHRRVAPGSPFLPDYDLVVNAIDQVEDAINTDDWYAYDMAVLNSLSHHFTSTWNPWAPAGSVAAGQPIPMDK